MRRWLRWTVVILLVALVGYSGFVSYVSYRSAESLVHPAREALNATPASVGLAFENVSTTTSDGLTLRGWWIPTNETGTQVRGTIVFLHGYGDSKDQSLEYVPFLHNDSLNVVVFDFRAHGQSDGDHTTVGLDETRDVLAGVAFAKARCDECPIALFGLSMGAAAAINAAPDADAWAIVSDSAFATLQNIASNSITHFTHLPKYPYGPVAVFLASRIVHEDVAANAPVRALARPHAPILFIQGGADDIARPATDGEALHRADPKSEYQLVDGAHHVESHKVDPARYEGMVTGFLNAHLLRT